MHRSAVVRRPLALWCVLVAALPAMACAGPDGRSRDGAVEPVAAAGASDGATATTDPGRPDGGHAERTGGEAPPPAAPTTGTAADRGPAPDDTVQALVQSVLDRYDAALTAVAADPLAATPGSPGLALWHAAVVQDGSFSSAMLADLTDRAAHESTVVRPGPDGHSYRHHAVRAVADGEVVSFTWCGHSPGVGVDIATGSVVDDAVAVSHGTGELRHDGAEWRVLTLDAFDLDLAPHGTPDGCPAEAAAAGTAPR